MVFTPGTQLTANETLSVTASASGKTASDALTIQVQAVSDDASVTATPTVTDAVYTNSSEMHGEAEPLASVFVKNGGQTIGAALASQDGAYTVKFAASTQLSAGMELTVQAAAPGKATSQSITVTVYAAPAEEPGPGGSVSLEYLAHSSFILSTDETAILMDPWNPVSLPMWKLPGYAPPELPITTKDIDVITISHEHGDHNYADAVEVDDQNILSGVLFDSKEFTYFYNAIQQTRGDVTISTEKVWHFPLRPDVERNFIDITDPEDMDRFESEAANAAFIFETNGMRIVHLGDGMGPIEDGLSTTDIYDYSDLISGLKGNKGIDILMIPIGGPDGVSPLAYDKLIEAIQTLQPKVVIPMHPWDTLEQFVEAVKGEFGAPVYKPSEISFSASDLPAADQPVIWILEKSFQPISDLKASNITDTTVTFSFTQPAEAEIVKLQMYDDNDQNWVDAAAVNHNSVTATVTGLAPNTEYRFRLFVKGGEKNGISNRVDVVTALPNDGPKLESLELFIGEEKVPFAFDPNFAYQDELIVDQKEYFVMKYQVAFDESKVNTVTFEHYLNQSEDPILTMTVPSDGTVMVPNDVLMGTNMTVITVEGKDGDEVTYYLNVSSRVELLPNFQYYFVTYQTKIYLFEQLSAEELINVLSLRPGATATVWTSYDSGTEEFGSQVTSGKVEEGYVVKITGLDGKVYRVYTLETST